MGVVRVVNGGIWDLEVGLEGFGWFYEVQGKIWKEISGYRASGEEDKENLDDVEVVAEDISRVELKSLGDEELETIETELLQQYYEKEQQKEEPNEQLVVFDMITMIALKYFEMKKVDFAVLEVGLGGAYDSTNVICPECSVISKPIIHTHSFNWPWP